VVLPDVIAEATGPGPDRLAGARRELKVYLPGPDHPDALTRFNNAVEALATRATRPAQAAPAYPAGAAPAVRLAGADAVPSAAAAEDAPQVGAVSGA
jgi:hypothetical protein